MKVFVAAAVLVSLAAIPTASSASDNVSVTTIAGSGRTGFEDGGAAQASFIMPMGMAYDRDGNLYVADGAAQRIRVIYPSGAVRTVAGGGEAIDGGFWVRGGYADGTGSEARFNRPDGVAVGPDGNIYIADSYNHCIRRMTPQGVVTTFAGNPSKAGNADGPRLSAQFSKPMGLAFDKDGNLYVVDGVVRKIDAAGNVSSFLVGNQPVDVAVANTTAGPAIFVTGYEGIVVRLPAGKLERWSTVEARLDSDRLLQGGKQLGHPFGIAAYNDHQIVYSDARSETVRFLDTRYGLERVIVGKDTDDAAAENGGYRDGLGSGAQVNSPMGMTLDKNGSIVFSDAGNRRIRKISPPDLRAPLLLSAGLFGEYKPAPDNYTVALAGNSFVWYNTDWQTSLERQIERNVDSAAHPRSGLRVIPIWGTGSLDATDDYLRNMLDLGLFDAMLVNINAIDISRLSGIDISKVSASSDRWGPQLTQKIRTFKDDAAKAGIPIAVVIEPLANQLSPSEQLWAGLTVIPRYSPDFRFHQLLANAIKKSGAPLIDLWPAFESEERSTNHLALYGTDDPHLSANGRAIAAAQIARALVKMAPWRHRP